MTESGGGAETSVMAAIYDNFELAFAVESSLELQLHPNIDTSLLPCTRGEQLPPPPPVFSWSATLMLPTLR